MTLDETDFIGRGWTFPVRISGSGGIRLTTLSEELDASIGMVISTAPGERVMRPDFGCRIWDQLFEPVNTDTMAAMEQAVIEAIQMWEPRVTVSTVTAEPDPEIAERVNVSIEYVVRQTNDRRNLVYPFYVIPLEGEE